MLAPEEPLRTAAGTVVIFDYDWTLIDTNSDTWIIEQLHEPTHASIMRRARTRRGQWTQLMDEALVEMQANGVSIEAIRECASRVPFHPDMLEGAKFAAGLPSTSVHVISDANTTYIESFLEAQGLRGRVQSLVTNPTYLDPDSRLRVRHFHAHTCAECPPNLCKSAALDLVLDGSSSARAATTRPRVVYVGDGRGDWCPVANRLGPQDIAFVRASEAHPSARGLLDALETAPPGRVTCKIVKWETGEDFLAALRAVL